MAPVLEDLLNDGRLARLFSTDDRHCALQLWVLQIKSEQSVESRVVYGRLVPYNHSSNSWSASDDDHFQALEHIQAQVVRVSLYVKSTHCADLLRQLSAGRTIQEVSDRLELRLAGKHKTRFGAVALSIDHLAYRPVAHLLNRDAYDRRVLSSPHGGASALSASITKLNKAELFQLGQDYDPDLTSFVVNRLNADTGMDFGGADAIRLGDLELLVFPALDDTGRCLLNVDWTDGKHALVAQFNPMEVPYFSGFQFHLSITNDGQVAYSSIVVAERDTKDVFAARFELSDQLQARVDSAELEVFGFHDGGSRESTLCCRWRGVYIREIHLQGHIGGRYGSNPVKFDWLEKTTRPAVVARVKAALTISRDGLGFTDVVGGREADPWVPASRDLVSLFARLHPVKSEACFFQRWGLDDGAGRLELVEWFKALLAKYQDHQVVIFDPYFETAGLGLVLLCATPKTDYIVFTSLPKPPKDGAPERGESDDPSSGERINNLVADCEQNLNQLRRIKLRIYGLRYGQLHDRYILIMGADKLPVAGFNLSNSLQTAAQNYPLLVTPIPADALLKVERYKSDLVGRAAEAMQAKSEAGDLVMRLLFSSTMSPVVSSRYEPLRFLEKPLSGDVLSVWLGEPSLRALSGDPLKERMSTLGLLEGDSLALPEATGLRNCLDRLAGDFTDFTATWEILGEVFAHSRAGDDRSCDLESVPGFLDFLARFLAASFERTHDEVSTELAVIDTKFFRESIDGLRHGAYHPHHFCHPTKPTIMTWAEYFAIKFLWRHAPDSLLRIAESQMAEVSAPPQDHDALQHALLGQIVSDISLSVRFEISDGQRERLVLSGNGFLRWIGLNAIEMLLEKPGGLVRVLQLVSAFSHFERIQTLGWMVSRAAREQERGEIYSGLVAGLHEALPPIISASELRDVVNSMRGHMRQLAWTGSWLFEDVILPLLNEGRCCMDDACEIWEQELVAMLEPESKDLPRLFDSRREGQTTNCAAYLVACSTPPRRRASLQRLRAVLKRQQRIVQQPLASTSDWTRWDGALTVSLWVLSFTKWVEYYLRQNDISNHELVQLSQDAQALAMVRPMAEWRVNRVGKPGQLAAFLDQVEELLVASD